MNSVQMAYILAKHLLSRTKSLARGLFRLSSDIDGVAAIELSIIAPMLVLALVCTADLGLGIYRNMQVQNAAQAGAEYAVTHGFVADSIVGQHHY